METMMISNIHKLKSLFMPIFYFNDNCRFASTDCYTQISSIRLKLKDIEGKLKYIYVSFKWNLATGF